MIYKHSISISLLFLLCACLMNSCKKKEEKFIISGIVKNPYTEQLIVDVEAKLLGQKIESGVLNSNYNLIQSAKTDQYGAFNFSFDIAYYSGYRLEFSKDQFINSITEINPNEIEKDVDYKRTYDFFPEAFLRLNICNIFPTSDNDYISYRIINDASGNEGCCSNTFVSFSGPVVNESIVCKSYGGHTITIEWIVTEGSNMVNHSHQLTCTPFDTIMYSIVY